MNTYGALKELKRTRIGIYDLQKATLMNQISLSNLIDIKILFKNYQKIILNDYLIRLIKNGVYLDQRQIITTEPFIVTNYNHEWIAYYEPIQKYKYIPKYFF